MKVLNIEYKKEIKNNIDLIKGLSEILKFKSVNTLRNYVDDDNDRLTTLEVSEFLCKFFNKTIDELYDDVKPIIKDDD
jgi:hypothetical protein